MKSRIISIGDELLRGDTVNTNASWLGEILIENGWPVTEVYTVGDSAGAIKEVIGQAMNASDLVITTGGLGPTQDDLTKNVVAEIFDARLVLHEPTLKFIKERFKERNIPFSESNYHQAEVPDNCQVLPNEYGTAPGLWIEENGGRLAVLPGIPHEMKALVQNEVLPRLKPVTEGKKRIFSRHIKVAGIGESTLSDNVLGPLDDFITEDISVAFLPSTQVNTIRINTQAISKRQADKKCDQLIRHIYKKAGKYIIGEGRDLTLSKAVGKVLRDYSLKIAVAESCTGGLLSNVLTDTPGSSDYMVGGLTAYANEVKMSQLDVPKEMLAEYGAVSRPVALQMAKAVARLMKADVGVSTTGIAGPGGGTDEKPVGTVWIGFWSSNRHFALRTHFTDDRLLNKERSVAVALETVRRTIIDVEPMPYGLNSYPA
ncbi:MAG TPA: competence/damage-inducible protein A [Balneolaceae bacterium]|nr:competence/damage-inducible protein A [Balneolaceae bacterium]